jgi:hypothetical protein
VIRFRFRFQFQFQFRLLFSSFLYFLPSFHSQKTVLLIIIFLNHFLIYCFHFATHNAIFVQIRQVKIEQNKSHFLSTYTLSSSFQIKSSTFEILWLHNRNLDTMLIVVNSNRNVITWKCLVRSFVVLEWLVSSKYRDYSGTIVLFRNVRNRFFSDVSFECVKQMINLIPPLLVRL